MNESGGTSFFVPGGGSAPGERPEYEFAPGCKYYGPDDIGAVRARFALPDRMDPATIPNRLTDVRYGTLESQLLDLYYPDAGAGPFPLIFYVHGGGWVMGCRRDSSISCILSGALEQGFAVASVEYRLAPETRFPENLYDVKTAVRCMRANAAKYRVDPERFGMAGDSAGGYFTLMVAATANVPALEGEQYGWAGVSSAVQAAVDFYGPVDMERDWAEYYAASGVKRLPMKLKGRPTMEELEFSSVSAQHLAPLVCPHRYVHPAMPPVLLLHGVDDCVVPYQHSEIMARRIREVCGEGRAKLLLYPGRVHSDRDFMDGESARIAAAFCGRVFRGEPPFGNDPM